MKDFNNISYMSPWAILMKTVIIDYFCCNHNQVFINGCRMLQLLIFHSGLTWKTKNRNDMPITGNYQSMIRESAPESLNYHRNFTLLYLIGSLQSVYNKLEVCFQFSLINSGKPSISTSCFKRIKHIL